ncbi:activating transcription factor 7-interacting protein 1 isoform X2 [Varanus komodoensis]|uniref:Activating transcription factor 7 interacting protein n=2 Tax=Varanus komodoensis TaxID=61221 RepID=A0A8D2KZC9_VARKO|nr:activating transcription factor 7-interacting protein 1 isoform X2 [Varanus komodoensis]XP_044311223.1 activating transcription factor 7-interacting protein 1 isoform X2 [Varanus komodoensis]XP_044311224.1 activating transcription factor 7-interacting protein 1 isoform X2 [Varanus komodoensis]XP_044311225.1 activating transcription factor 7-interacting protein 1 isoform X2 [Varanus komodoensis]XP_044311226.1 activating transcription factor 7-interacting protein 1 isoform X2 [Varanus komodoen
MESNEEPQKKVFKARKTMRASDRQQLESVYKVKEELLKTTDVKLLNGKHENGDSDLSSSLLNSDCTEDKEVNGIEDLCLDSEEGKMDSEEITEVKSPDIENQGGDLNSKLETPPENIVSEQKNEDAHCTSGPVSESQVLNCNKDNDIQDEVNVKDNLDHKIIKDDLDQKATLKEPEEESQITSNINNCIVEPVETKELALSSDLAVEEEKNTEEAVVKEMIGEETISSSLDRDNCPKDEDVQSTDLVDTSVQKAIEGEPAESILGNAGTMETDEIIPILEKLAPADELNCFSKSILVPVENSNLDSEDKVENSVNSPLKHESSENLPKEAFLVLSDEEELCCDKEAELVIPNHASPSEKEDEEEEKELDKVEEKEHNKEEEKPPERSEASRRKRSKSEDMDNIHSKRRRYMREEYEAEFEVKITARGDVHQKLEKVIHQFLEEKFSALQCAIFDKSLADLKTRVDKIECSKRHKTVLTELQAKIARLTKRFGAAREDSKKRTENLQNTPHSPGKAMGDTSNLNTVAYRNAGTVRQMLESKRNVGDTFQSPVTTVSATTLTTPQTPVSGHPKPQTPVTSAPLTSGTLTSVLPTANTATVVGTSQVAGGNTQPMSVSLQSLPVILHVPVAMSSQPQLLQGHTGTLVTNQQSGSVEFIPVQSQSNVGNLTKTPLSLSSANSVKPNSSPSVPSSSIQRNSPASVGCSIGTTLAVQAVSTAHPVAQATRTTLATVNTSGVYTPTTNRNSIQMKIPLSAFSNTAPSEANSTVVPRVESQTSRLLPPPLPPTDISANKKASEIPSQSGKVAGSAAGGVIDLTLDDEDDGTSQDGKKQNQSNMSGMGLSTQSVARPLQPVQTNPLQQAGVPTSGLSQTTIHVLPTAQTTVNVTHRPMTQASARLPVPRAPANHQVVYTTLPAPSGQNPVRTTVMQSPNLRQVTPQSSGVTVRMPQTTAYVVNNGLTLGSGGPQLTVHHRPPQVHSEPLRPVHPAPLPEAPQPSRLPPEAANTSLPQKPHLKLARVQSQNGIVLSWSVLEVDRSCASVDSYHLYAYHEDPSATVPSQWKKIGEVKALPLPMACTLTQFVSGSKYYFAVRAKDIYGRFGPFCDPQSTDVIASQGS